MGEYPAKITEALHNVMTKVGYVQKKGKNTFHQYNYAGEKDLLEALRPALVEAGLLLIPSGVDHSAIDEYGNTQVSVAYTLAHKDGDVWPEKIVAFGCGNDKNSKGGVQDKGTYKALTGANKYLLFKLFQIETGDDPEKSETVAPAPVVFGPLNKTALKKALHEFAGDLANCSDQDELAAFLESSKAVMEQAERDAPMWWFTQDGSDSLGLADRVAEAKRTLPEASAGSLAPTAPRKEDAPATPAQAQEGAGADSPARKWFASALEYVADSKEPDALKAWWKANSSHIESMSDDMKQQLMAAKDAKKAEFGQTELSGG